MRFRDDHWIRAIIDWIPWDINRPRGRKPVRLSDFFAKALNEWSEALCVPGASRYHWATLAYDRDEWRRYWCLLEQIKDQQDGK